MYTTIWYILQKLGILLGVLSDREELVGSITGEGGLLLHHSMLDTPLVQVLSPLLDIVDVRAHLTYSFLYSVNLAVHPVLR